MHIFVFLRVFIIFCIFFKELSSRIKISENGCISNSFLKWAFNDVSFDGGRVFWLLCEGPLSWFVSLHLDPVCSLRCPTAWAIADLLCKLFVMLQCIIRRVSIKHRIFLWQRSQSGKILLHEMPIWNIQGHNSQYLSNMWLIICNPSLNVLILIWSHFNFDFNTFLILVIFLPFDCAFEALSNGTNITQVFIFKISQFNKECLFDFQEFDDSGNIIAHNAHCVVDIFTGFLAFVTLQNRNLFGFCNCKFLF